MRLLRKRFLTRIEADQEDVDYTMHSVCEANTNATLNDTSYVKGAEFLSD